MTEEKYQQLALKTGKNSPKIKDFAWAFVVGGIVCTIGELCAKIYASLGFENNQVKMMVPVTLIFIAVLLTAFKVFDNIAKRAGAGTLVPITGFANAVAAPAIEFKSEGHILGIGVKMFSIAGPVILYGTATGVIYGIVYYFVQMIWGKI